MKEAPLEMTLLFDFYGDILTPKQKDFFDLYHNNDLSLSEIAENVGITRQGVRDAIARAEAVLRDMEEKLGLVARYSRIKAHLIEISDAAKIIEDINDRRTGHGEIRVKSQRIQTLAALLAEDGL